MQKGKRNNALSAQKRGKRKPFFSLQTKKFTKKISRRLLSQRTSSVMLIVGLCLILIGGLQSIQAHSNPSFDGELPNTSSPQGSNAPIEITIPSANIDLPIHKTVIEKGEWQVSDSGVSHLASSSNLDVDGNIILYGHNTHDFLGRLHRLKLGESILLKDLTGKNYIYKVTSVKIVDPTEIDELIRFEGQTLSIYTCTGFADLKRLLIKAQKI